MQLTLRQVGTAMQRGPDEVSVHMVSALHLVFAQVGFVAGARHSAPFAVSKHVVLGGHKVEAQVEVGTHCAPLSGDSTQRLFGPHCVVAQAVGVTHSG